MIKKKLSQEYVSLYWNIMNLISTWKTLSNLFPSLKGSFHTYIKLCGVIYYNLFVSSPFDIYEVEGWTEAQVHNQHGYYKYNTYHRKGIIQFSNLKSLEQYSINEYVYIAKYSCKLQWTSR